LSLYKSCNVAIVNFYNLARNKRKLSFLYKELNSSCAKTLASKYSLSTQNKVINKFGSNLINRPLSKVGGLPDDKLGNPLL
jgi:hypothetical protein